MTGKSYDVTKNITEYLDSCLINDLYKRHMEAKIYAPEEVRASQISNLSSTNMIREMEDFLKENKSDELSAAVQKKKNQLEKEWNSLKESMEFISAIIDKSAITEIPKGDKQACWRALIENEFKPDYVPKLINFSEFAHSIGAYEESRRYLSVFNSISSDPKKLLRSYWGKLAADIILGNSGDAFTDILQLKDLFESKNLGNTPLQLLQNRLWLLHWSLFAVFSRSGYEGSDGYIDLFLQNSFLNVIQTSSPYLLRYLACMIVMSKNRERYVKDLARYCRLIAYQYEDPITSLITSLFHHCDFEKVSECLKELPKLIDEDVFLYRYKEELIHAIQRLCLGVCTDIFSKTTLKQLAKMLMTNESDENLISSLRDSKSTTLNENSVSFKFRKHDHRSKTMLDLQDMDVKTQVMMTKIPTSD